MSSSERELAMFSSLRIKGFHSSGNQLDSCCFPLGLEEAKESTSVSCLAHAVKFRFLNGPMNSDSLYSGERNFIFCIGEEMLGRVL